MSGENQVVRDDVDGWVVIADALCRLRLSTEYAQEFTKKFSKYMTKKEQPEMAALSSRYDAIYYRNWEKLIKKIRGI